MAEGAMERTTSAPSKDSTTLRNSSASRWIGDCVVTNWAMPPTAVRVRGVWPVVKSVAPTDLVETGLSIMAFLAASFLLIFCSPYRR